ncbi:16673_t:CDS:2 [Dentiscutata heterogama]|uniref:16673_t:CDS:1 n=1 Tax=Dentiscutata heterogama TaxID=1316150 RepID=A0ACA9L041_9GLOM|nr:16673_t:CDS:2 [Dentiscutata heterogama]
MLLKNENDSDNDLHMGSNCRFLHFSQEKAVIKPSDESKYDLLKIIGKKDDKYYLYINQNAEFDLTQLRFEKGFLFEKNGSIISAPVRAFKINIDETKIEKKEEINEKVYSCNHEKNVNCKRPLIFDLKLSTACSELFSTSIGFSHENSDQTHTQHVTSTKRKLFVKGELSISDKNISLEKNFIEDIKNVLSDTTHDKIRKLHEISKNYGHFYVRRLIFGGAIIKKEEYTKNLVKCSKVKATNTQFDAGIAANSLKAEVNIAHRNEDTHNNSSDNTNIVETSIGGTNYSQYDENTWKQSLNDPTTWKIIGYEGVYSLFELLDNELKKEVLGIVGHQILEAKVDEIKFDIEKYEKAKKPYTHNLITNINMSECNIIASIKSEEGNIFSQHVEYMDKNKNYPVIVIHHIKIEIKLGLVIIGPPKDFNFSIEYPLVLESKKYQVPRESNYHIIHERSMFGTCALEAPQVKNNSGTGEATYYKFSRNPKDSRYAIGNYLKHCQKSMPTWVFVYDIKDKKKVTDEKVLENLALYSCIVDITCSRQINEFFGEKKINWIKEGNKEILYSEKVFDKFPNDNLILVNQIFDHDFMNCQPLGFVNIISDKICYGPLDSEQLNIDGKCKSIFYLSISPKSIPKGNSDLLNFSELCQ